MGGWVGARGGDVEIEMGVRIAGVERRGGGEGRGVV